MDNVSAENQRNLESGLLHDDFLHLVGILDPPDVDDGADSSINKSLDDILRDGLVSTGHLEKLPNLLLNGHNGKILLNGLLDIFLGFDLLDHGLKLLEINSLTLHLVHLLLTQVNSHSNK